LQISVALQRSVSLTANPRVESDPSSDVSDGRERRFNNETRWTMSTSRERDRGEQTPTFRDEITHLSGALCAHAVMAISETEASFAALEAFMTYARGEGNLCGPLGPSAQRQSRSVFQ